MERGIFSEHWHAYDPLPGNEYTVAHVQALMCTHVFARSEAVQAWHFLNIHIMRKKLSLKDPFPFL